MTWDRRKCSLFTVEGCSPKTNRIISPSIQKKLDREKVFTIKGCSLIRGVHYERFHCTCIATDNACKLVINLIFNLMAP